MVDLPAPLGPTKPVTRPGATEKVMPSSAWVAPNRLRSPDTSIVASLTVVVRFLVAGTGRRSLYAMAGRNSVVSR